MAAIRLPSGEFVDIDRPDFSLCKSANDFLEVKYALSEEIIDIELQIDMFESGAGIAQGRSYEVDWLPRARASLKWAKLYRDEAQNRQGRLAQIEKQVAHASTEQAVIRVIKATLTPDQFTTLLAIAEAVARAGISVHPSRSGAGSGAENQAATSSPKKSAA